MAALTGILFIILSTLSPYFLKFTRYASPPPQEPQECICWQGKMYIKEEANHANLSASSDTSSELQLCVQQIWDLDISNSSVLLWVSCFLSVTLSSRLKCHGRSRKTQALVSSKRFPEVLNTSSWQHLDHKIPDKHKRGQHKSRVTFAVS